MTEQEISQKIQRGIDRGIDRFKQGQTEETVKNLEGMINDISSNLDQMVTQLKNIEGMLEVTHSKLMKHIDTENHDKLVMDMFRRLIAKQKLEFWKELTESAEVHNEIKKKILKELKDVRGNVSWKVLAGLGVFLSGIIAYLIRDSIGFK
jgi:Skp family chaperone for outer membrane proteins